MHRAKLRGCVGERHLVGLSAARKARLIELDIAYQTKLSTAIGYAAAAIELIDPTQRITDAVAARISGAEYRAWRTQAQHAASPGSVTGV